MQLLRGGITDHFPVVGLVPLCRLTHVRVLYKSAIEDWPYFSSDLASDFSTLDNAINMALTAKKLANHTLTNVGPPKNHRTLSAGIFLTEGYWQKGNKHRDFFCIDGEDVGHISGMTKIGAELIENPPERKLTTLRLNHFLPPPTQKGAFRKNQCSGAGFCNGAGEFCLSYKRQAGCLVSTNWLDWYRWQLTLRGEVENQSEICSEAQSPWG